MRGKGGIPLLPGRSRGFPDLVGLAAQPAQNVGGLAVLGTLDVLTHVDNAPLELRFERWWRRSRIRHHARRCGSWLSMASSSLCLSSLISRAIKARSG